MLQFDFDNIQEPFKVTKEFIQANIPSEEIYNRYLGQVDFRRGTRSPFSTDRTASFKFLVRDNTLLYKDFSTGKSGDAIKLVCELNPTESFPQILERIAKDFGLLNGKNINTPIVKKIYQLPAEEPVIIKVVPRDWDHYSLPYWIDYKVITLPILKHFNIKPCNEVWIQDRQFYTFNKNNPAYRYTRDNGFKIYQPLNSHKKDKWRNNIPSSSVWGLEQLTFKTDTVFIVSSVKDVAVMFGLGMEAVCMNSETCEIPDWLINWLKTKYKHVVIFLDNDTTGIQFAKRCHKRTDCVYLYIPLTEKFKDQSDLVKGTSPTYTKEIIMDLLNEYVY